MKIKRRKFVDPDEQIEIIEEFDIEGRLIYVNHNSAYEEWSKYDAKGNCIYRKFLQDKDIAEYFWDYDNKGNIIHEKIQCNGKIMYEEWKEYDKNNNMIHYKDLEGNEIIHEYDDNGNEITGYDCTFYDENEEA